MTRPILPYMLPCAFSRVTISQVPLRRQKSHLSGPQQRGGDIGVEEERAQRHLFEEGVEDADAEEGGDRGDEADAAEELRAQAKLVGAEGWGWGRTREGRKAVGKECIGCFPYLGTKNPGPRVSLLSLGERGGGRQGGRHGCL